MAQKGDRRRGRPLNPDLGYAGDPVHHATSNLPPQRIGIRELRQHASVYVDLVERGYTVDITNRGRLVAQMIPVRDPDSPLERWIAKGVIERAEDDGSVLDIDPYAGPAAGQPAASEALAQLRSAEGTGAAAGEAADSGAAPAAGKAPASGKAPRS
jgi:prevent-host-death family protein